MSQPIFDRLKALRGLPALKQLLYEDLGYPRANQILSTRDWPTTLMENFCIGQLMSSVNRERS